MNNKSNKDIDENCAKFLIVAIILAILGYSLYSFSFSYSNINLISGASFKNNILSSL